MTNLVKLTSYNLFILRLCLKFRGHRKIIIDCPTLYKPNTVSEAVRLTMNNGKTIFFLKTLANLEATLK